MALVHEKIIAVLGELDAIPKTKHNPGGGDTGVPYAFRGIDDVVVAMNPLLQKHGLFFYPELRHLDTEISERVSGNRSVAWERAHVQVAFHIVASDGSEIVVVTPGEGYDNSDKATNKAMSGALKYALLQTFAIATRDLEDPDASTPAPPTDIYPPRGQSSSRRDSGQRAPSRRDPTPENHTSDAPATPDQLKAFWSAMSRFGISNADVHAMLGVSTTKDVPWRFLLGIMNAVPKRLRPVRSGSGEGQSQELIETTLAAALLELGWETPEDDAPPIVSADLADDEPVEELYY